MPNLDFENRSLNYAQFGSKGRISGKATVVALANEYRTIEDGFGQFFGGFGSDVDVVILENTNMGASTKLDRPLTQDELVPEVLHACKALEIEFPLFVGYCGNVELGFLSSKALQNSGVIMFSPMMRIGEGRFVEHFYSILRRAILERDAQLLTDILLTIDPHSREHQASRHFPLVERHGAEQVLNDADFFWLQTQQNKPIGNWKWETLPSFDHPVLLVTGCDDPLQPASLLNLAFKQPQHQIAEIDCSHRILDNCPDDVRRIVSDFVDYCSGWTEVEKAS